MRKESTNTESDMLIHIERLVNALAVLSLLLLSVVVFAYQVILHQLPCPLCLLQRLGFLAIAFGFLLNLRFGLQPSHYSLILLSALFNSFVALRQITLDTNAEGGYHSATLFGFQLQTWSFIISLIIVVGTAIILGFARKYEKIYPQHSYWKTITSSLFGMLALIIFANMVSAFLLCGLKPCPLKPIGYKLLSVVQLILV